MNINKKFLLKLFVLLIIIVSADRLVGHVLQSLYFKTKYNKSYYTNYAVNQVNDDVLIFGASRASHHYIPSILSDSLQMSVFNCGSDGQSIFYHYGLLMKIKERYLPKLIILDLSPTDFYKNIYSIEGVKDLTPYYGSNKDLDSLINQISPFEKFKMVSMCYRYNSKIVEIFRDNFRQIEQNENGYEPLFEQMKPIPSKISLQEEKIIDPEKIYYLEKFIAFCKQNNIKIVLSISPIYYIWENNNDFTLVENIAKKYNVPLYNHWCDSGFTGKNVLFKDGIHLDNDGAIKYSSIIAKEIQLYLRNFE